MALRLFLLTGNFSSPKKYLYSFGSVIRLGDTKQMPREVWWLQRLSFNFVVHLPETATKPEHVNWIVLEASWVHLPRGTGCTLIIYIKSKYTGSLLPSQVLFAPPLHSSFHLCTARKSFWPSLLPAKPVPRDDRRGKMKIGLTVWGVAILSSFLWQCTGKYSIPPGF